MKRTTSRIRAAAMVRVLVLLLSAAGLAKLMANPQRMYPYAVSGWILFAFFESALVVAAVRMILFEVIEPREGLVLRTRNVPALAELVIGVFGLGMLLGLGALISAFGTRYQPPTPWAHPRSHVMEVVSGAVALVIGFIAVFFRPVFVFKAGKLRRYPFGRTLPIRVQDVEPVVRVLAEGYYVDSGSSRFRQGFMIRAHTSAGTFELELLPEDPGAVSARVRHWQDVLRENGMTVDTASDRSA